MRWEVVRHSWKIIAYPWIILDNYGILESSKYESLLLKAVEKVIWPDIPMRNTLSMQLPDTSNQLIAKDSELSLSPIVIA